MHLLKHVEELHEISGDMKLDGFLSLDGANSKVKVASLSVALFFANVHISSRLINFYVNVSFTLLASVC